MKDNNTSPAMKEVEKAALEEYPVNMDMTPEVAKFFNEPQIDLNEDCRKAFIAGAQWREENPVMGEVKSDMDFIPDAEKYFSVTWDSEQPPFVSKDVVVESYCAGAFNGYQQAITLPPTPKQDKEWVRAEDVITIIEDWNVNAPQDEMTPPSLTLLYTQIRTLVTK